MHHKRPQSFASLFEAMLALEQAANEAGYWTRERRLRKAEAMRAKWRDPEFRRRQEEARQGSYKPWPADAFPARDRRAEGDVSGG